ncbi:MAG: hypothetical protein DRP08_05395 [Candidatus Aenigmatarchaeota archaeon]|nr:MAG: hypothetical protein DRP08_05395 [Candidatus Aenigmarchaeota archaeon]
MTLEEFRERLRAEIQDKAGELSDAELDSFIEDALRMLSERFGKIEKTDLTVQGGECYTLSNFDPDLSSIIAVEHPKGEVPPSLLDEESYYLYDPTEPKVCFQEGVEGEVRIWYVVPWSDVSELSELGIALLLELSLYRALLGLSKRYLQSLDPSLDADTFNRLASSNPYSALAEKHFDNFERLLKRKLRQAGMKRRWRREVERIGKEPGEKRPL